MKRACLMVALILFFTVSTWGQTTNFNIFGRPTSDWFSSQDSRRNIPLQWMRAVDPLIGASSGQTSSAGDTFYVDSAVANEGDGTSWLNAKNTLTEAVALCSSGDTIKVKEGHNESWTAADAGALTVAGITVEGYGTGTNMPRFDYDGANAELVLGAANIHIINLAFLPSTNQTVHAIEIEADADGSVIENCWFMDGESSGTDEFIDAIQPAALADNITVVGCRFETWGGAGANTGIDMTAGVLSDWKIWGNYFYGDYAEAPIYSDNDVHLRAWVEANVCQNTNSGEYGIEFGGAATGVLIDNRVYTDSLSTAIDPGSLSCLENYAINTIDLSAARIPANTLDAIVTDLAGISQIGDKVVADMDANSVDTAILNDLAGISQVGDKVVADMDANSLLVNWTAARAAILSDLAGISQIGDKVVADMDANSTLASFSTQNLDHLQKTAVANGDDLTAEVVDGTVLSNILTMTGDTSDFARATMSIEALAAVLNDLAGISQIGDKIVADMDANSTGLNIVDDLQGISQVGDKVVADMDANSLLANWTAARAAIVTDLAGISEIGDKIVADMDANSTSLDILTDLGGISQVGDKVQADMDVNSVLYWQERTAYTTADEVSSDLFTVAGGPILITSMVGYVDVQIGAAATTCKLWIDTTAGASYDQDFSTAVNIETDAVGTTYVFTNVNPSVLTPLTPGSNGATTLMTPWFCPVGTVEQLMNADPGGAGGDHLTWYMTYKPLKAGVTVTGVSP